MFNSIPHSIIQKNTCQHKEQKCNHLNPYNNLELYGSKLTDKEKKNNLKRYNTACQNRKGDLKVCCDKNDPRLEDVLAKMKYKKPLGKSVYDKFGNLESIDFCLESDPEKCDTKYKKLSAYEICKIPKTNNDLVDGKLTNFKQDCYQAKCNPQEKTMNISGIVEENYTYEFDKDVAESIKHNKLINVQKFIQQDRTLLKRPLTHSNEGNTIYHEALKYNAKHVLVYLFSNITQDIINKLNSRGNSILHMVMEQDNKNTLMMALKMGCDVNAKNNKNETPLFNAIKAGLYDNVRLILNYSANLYVVNKDGDTPLLLAVKTPKKNLKIIRLLVDNGANIKDENEEKNYDVISLLNDKKNRTVEEEEILTYFNHKFVKDMDIIEGTELDTGKTKELEGYLYEVENKDKYEKMYDFNITVEFEEKDLNFPKELHYPKDLKEKKMKPHDLGDKNYSHEPYYNKFKNLQKDKIKQLRQTIQLTKWDNNLEKEQKLQIIDEIMSGELSLDNYRKKVMVNNKITKEQEFLLDNISENDIYDYESPMYSPSLEEEVVLITEKNKNNKEIPIDITTTKIMEIPPTPSPTYNNILIREEEEDDFYDNNSYIILAILILISIGVIYLIYRVTQQKKLDFFN